MTILRNAMSGAGSAPVVGGARYLTRWWPSYAKAADANWPPVMAHPDNRLAYLVHYATHAANAHNTQPCLFASAGDDVIIAPDLSRRTPVVDPNDHHVFARLGCLAENLALAAEAIGRSY